MNEAIEVFAIGSSVLLDGSVSARVTAIFIRQGSVSYEVVWWNDRKREENIVGEWEISPDGESAQKSRVSQIL